MRTVRAVWNVVALAGLVAVPAAGQQQEQEQEQAEADREAALLEAHKGDFDYLLGAWSFTTKNVDWGEGQGYWTAVRLASGEGSHILDEYRVVGEDGETYYVSTTLRTFNSHRGVWELVSAEDGTGLENVGTAERVGDEMHIEQRFGTSLMRIRYHHIRADGFSWAADRSFDDGATWQRDVMTIEAKRIGPARSLGPLAPAKPGGR